MSAPSPLEPLAWLQAQTEAQAQVTQNLESQLKQARKQLQLLEKLQAESLAAAYWQMGKTLQSRAAQTWLASLPPEQAEALLDETRQAAQQRQKRFPAHFAQACAAAELVLEPTSQHPRYQFAAGLLQIEIQDQTGTASIQTPVSQLARLPSDPEPLAQWLGQILAQWQARGFDTQTFLQALQQSRASCLAAGESEPLPLRSVLKAWLQAQRQRQPEHFVLDLLHWLQLPAAEQASHGLQLELLQTRDTQQGLFLPLPSRPGYFGWISLKFEEQA